MLQDELADDGLLVIAVALDDTPAEVREFAAGITYPVLIDPDHVLSELYAISNVPTVIWIDADGTIARPNAVEFGTDTFVEFTGVTAQEHMDQVRAWVHHGTLPSDASTQVADLSDDEIEARLAFRVAAHHRRQGDHVLAEEWFGRAARLAPFDFTIRRASMPLMDVDPFGEAFFELYGQWQEAGSPYHGVRRP